MGMIKSKKIRGMNAQEQHGKINELRLEIAKEIAASAVGGTVKNPGNIRAMRRTIARMLTIQKKQEGGKK